MYRDNLPLLSPLAELLKAQADLVSAVCNSNAINEQKEMVIRNAVETSVIVTKEIKSQLKEI